MKLKSILVTLLLCVAAASAVMAKTNPHMGTWKLNEAKSKIAPGAAKNHTVVYEAAGDEVKVTVDGVDGDGNPTHNEWTGKFNNKFFPVTGDATSDERSYKVVNSRTLLLTAHCSLLTVPTGTAGVPPAFQFRARSASTYCCLLFAVCLNL